MFFLIIPCRPGSSNCFKICLTPLLSFTVAVHINRLREKIEDVPAEPKLLQTVWGVGMVSCVVLLSSLFEQNIYFMSSLFLGLTVCSIPFVAAAEPGYLLPARFPAGRPHPAGTGRAEKGYGAACTDAESGCVNRICIPALIFRFTGFLYRPAAARPNGCAAAGRFLCSVFCRRTVSAREAANYHDQFSLLENKLRV